MKKTLSLIFALVTLCAITCSAQRSRQPEKEITLADIEQQEKEINSLFNKVKKAEKNDEIYPLAEQINSKMLNLIYEIYDCEELEIDPLEYDLPNIENIKPVISRDFNFVCYSWNIPLKSGINQYYTIFMDWEGNIFSMAQGLPSIPAQTGSLTETKWYGAMYYDFIPVKYKDKVVYFALGYLFDDEANYKVIETMQFSKRNVKMGVSMFNGFGIKRQTRVVFKYAKDAQFNIEYDKKKKNIKQMWWNQLEPMEDGSSIMIPNDSWDGIVYKKEKWNLQKDMKIKIKKDKKGRR